MDGIHDLGGMQGFGPVLREANELTFHADWEAHVLAISEATRGKGVMNIDEFRHGIERMDAAHYLESSYYEHWLDGISRVLIEKGVISAKDLEKRAVFFEEHPDSPATAAIHGQLPEPVVFERRGPPGFRREASAPPKFKPGDAVVTRVTHPRGHTRLAQYARGRRGVVASMRGVYVFPDTNAHGLGEDPQPLYSVAFEAKELWGEDAEPNQRTFIDLWEQYLLPA